MTRWLAILGVWLSLGLIIAIILFNTIFYPGFGLGGLKKEQYQEALLTAARSYAASEGLTLGSGLWSEFQSHKKETLAWGTLILLTPTGKEVNLWVSLAWSPFWHRWLRYKCELLADPRDRILFAESLLTLGNFRKVYFTVMNLSREELRRWREVCYGAGCGHGPKD